MSGTDPTTGANASSEPRLEPKETELATNPIQKDADKEEESAVCWGYMFPTLFLRLAGVACTRNEGLKI